MLSLVNSGWIVLESCLSSSSSSSSLLLVLCCVVAVVVVIVFIIALLADPTMRWMRFSCESWHSCAHNTGGVMKGRIISPRSSGGSTDAHPRNAQASSGGASGNGQHNRGRRERAVVGNPGRRSTAESVPLAFLLSTPYPFREREREREREKERNSASRHTIGFGEMIAVVDSIRFWKTRLTCAQPWCRIDPN